MVVSLAPFQPARASLLAEWLARPHVARWFPAPAAWIEAALTPSDKGGHALIVLDARPIGYMRWWKVGRETLDSVGLEDIPAGSADIDMLIGEADCVGRGYGPSALAALVTTLRADPSIPLAGLSPSSDNVAAIRAYAKAGFCRTRDYDAPGFGRCALMVMDFGRERVTPPPARA